MKTQVQQTKQIIELTNIEKDKRNSYIALLTFILSFFTLMTMSGIVYAIIAKTENNELTHTILFGMIAGFCGGLICCLIARTAMTYKFRWCLIGSWNLIINIVSICFFLCLTGLYVVDYFNLIDISTTNVLGICFLAMFMFYTAIIAVSVLFMVGFDSVYIQKSNKK